MDDSTQFFDVDGLAVYLGLVGDDGEPNRRAIYNMSFKGTGPRKHRIAGKLRFRRTDVEAWIASRAEPASRAS